MKQSLSSVQKITCITTFLNQKRVSVFCVSGALCSHLSLLIKFSFFCLVLFSPRIHNRREQKLNNNYMINRRFFKDVIQLFCRQGHLKHFLENYRFCRKSGNYAYSRWWGMGHVISVILTHCVRKLICDSSLITCTNHVPVLRYSFFTYMIIISTLKIVVT